MRRTWSLPVSHVDGGDVREAGILSLLIPHHQLLQSSGFPGVGLLASSLSLEVFMTLPPQRSSSASCPAHRDLVIFRFLICLQLLQSSSLSRSSCSQSNLLLHLASLQPPRSQLKKCPWHRSSCLLGGLHDNGRLPPSSSTCPPHCPWRRRTRRWSSCFSREPFDDG